MIIDKQLIMSDGQTGVTGSAESTYYIDATKAGDALAGAELYWVCRVKTALTSGSNLAYMAVSLETDSDPGFATAKVTLISTGAILVTSLVAGYVFVKAKLPTGLKRYLRTYYTETGEAFNGGALDSFLVADADILFT